MRRNLGPLDSSANINVCPFPGVKPTTLVGICVTRKWTLHLTDTFCNAKCLGTMNVSSGHQNETFGPHGAMPFQVRNVVGSHVPKE